MSRLVAWFVKNPIAANFLMLVMLVGGWLAIDTVKKEVFPSAAQNLITISKIYPGAAPNEVEQQIVIRIEEAIADLPGVFQIRSESREGIGTVTVEVIDGFEVKALLNDIKARVDSINTFPLSSERATISQVIYRMELFWFSMWGDTDFATMKELGYQLR